MDEIRFSIIIPVYNVEDYLNECLLSIINQKNFDQISIEIILVDDGSTDNSSHICDDFSDKYCFIRVVHQENKGLLQARRSGFKVAKGEYVINLDSDDYLVPDALQAINSAIMNSSPDVVFYNISVLENRGIRPYYSDVFTNEEICSLTQEKVIEAYFNLNIPVVTSMAGKAIKRSCLDLNRDYSKFGKLSTGEDTLQTAEIISRASAFCYLNKSIYIYRLGSGMTARFDPNFYWEFKKILTEVINDFEQVNSLDVNELINFKILSTGCRAITQSKLERKMSFKRRRNYFISILKDDAFSEAINSDWRNSIFLSNKYKWIIRLLLLHAYFPLHLALKIL